MTYEERLKRLKAAADAVRLGTMTAEQAAEALFHESPRHPWVNLPPDTHQSER